MRAIFRGMLFVCLFCASIVLADGASDALKARLARATGRERVDVLNELSKAQWGVSSDETIAWASQAVTAARSIDYPAGEACGLRYEGVGYWYKDDYKKALDFCLRALAIYDRIGDRQGMTACRSTIGTIYLNLDRFDEALKTYQDALAVAQQIGDQNRIGILTMNIGTVYLGMKKPADALLEFERALPIVRKVGSKLDILTCLGNIAGAHRRLGHLQEALDINKQILDLAAKSDSKVRLADAMTDTGQILGEMGRPSEAVTWVQKAIDLATKEDLKRNLTDAEQVMTAIQEKQGDYRSALAHQKRYAEVRNAVVTDENTRAMAELQVKYESEKKERQIQTQTLQIQRQQATRNLLIALAALAVVLLIATYGLYHAKKRENQLLERLSRTDPLTGLANRRALLEAAARESQRMQRDGRPYALILADVDHFKKFNDTHGHDTGDQVLIEVARAFRAAVREVDLVARWGGEEFLALLPATTAAEAMPIAERVQERIRAVEIWRNGTPIRITATFGVSSTGADADIDECLKRADLALYRGKEAGRDRIVA